MSSPTHPCGCEGTWNITGTNSVGGSINVNIAGYETDNPYLNNVGQTYNGRPTLSLISACDGRLIEPYWVYADTGYTAVIYTKTFTKTDPSCNSTTTYDCLNGACIPSSQYNTPGLYESSSACEEACGTGCSGVCVSSSDWAQIEGLANQLKQRNCS